MSDLQTEWGWDFRAKSKILGLHQADRTNHVALFDQEGGVYLLDENGKLLLELGFSKPVKSARVAAFGKVLFILDSMGQVHAFNSKGQNLWKVSTDDFMTCMDIRSEAQSLAVAGSNGMAVFLNGRGKKMRSIYLTHSVSFIKFSHDLGSLVASSQNGEISFLDSRFRFQWKWNMQTQCGGVDVNCDSSMILLTAFAEGIYACNHNREIIGAYEISGSVISSALCQKGQRVLACNPEGRLHAIRQDGKLEYYLDVHQNIPRMDLNYEGNCAALQVDDRDIRSLMFFDNGESSKRARVLNFNEESQSESHDQILWQAPLKGGGVAQIAYTINGSYCICLSEFNVLQVFDRDGKSLWEYQMDPGQTHSLLVSSGANTILVSSPPQVSYFTCQKGIMKNYAISSHLMAVHDGGLNFVILGSDQILSFFDKSGQSVWTKRLEWQVDEIQINPKGNGIFLGCRDEKLRVFRQHGKLGWEKKYEGEHKNLILGQENNGKVNNRVVRASDGYRFKDKLVAKSTSFSVDTYGLTLGNEKGEIFRVNSKGKKIWEHKIMEPVQTIKRLKDYILVRGRNANDYLFNKKGGLIQMSKPCDGLRQFVCNPEGELLLLESNNKVLTCENLTQNQTLWKHHAEAEITQFQAEIMGRKMVYLASGTLYCLPLERVPGPVSSTVAFLEF